MMKDMNITGNAIENLLMSYADHKAQVRLFMEDEMLMLVNWKKIQNLCIIKDSVNVPKDGLDVLV